MNFNRQFFGLGDQVGLLNESLDFWESFQARSCKSILFNKIQAIESDSCPISRLNEYKLRLQKIVNNSRYLLDSSYKHLHIYVDGFWPGFVFEKSALFYLFKAASGLDVREVFVPDEADIALYSIFNLKKPLDSTSHLVRYLFLGERVSPSYFDFDYSLSMDIPGYCGKNIYTPLWLLHLLESPYVTDFDINSFKFDLSTNQKRIHKAIFVGNNDHPLRRSLVSKLTTLGIEVDCYGSSFRPISDKIDLYSKYAFTICPENCWYPGYTTEKIVDSFLANSIPIYWGYLDKKIFPSEGTILLSCESQSLDELSMITQGLGSGVSFGKPWFNRDAVQSLINQIIFEMSKTFIV